MILIRKPESYYLELDDNEKIYMSACRKIEDFKQSWLEQMSNLFDNTINNLLMEDKNNESKVNT